MRRTSLFAAILGLFVLAAPLSASAQGNFPLEYSERPLTINEGTIAVQAALQYYKIADQEAGGITISFDPIISLLADVSYGITDDFEVNVLAVPLVLSPDTDYGNPVISGTYRFLRSAVELAGYVGLTLPVQDGSDFGLTVGMPALFGLTPTTKIVSGIYLPIVFADETVVSLSIPVEFAVNFSPQFFLNIFTGIGMTDLDPDLLSVPLGVGVGYTLPASADRPLGDLFARFSFPSFINGGDGDTIVTDILQFQIGGRFFLN